MVKRLILSTFIMTLIMGCSHSKTDPATPITVGISDLTIHESDGVAAFIFNLSSASQSPVSFDVSVVNETALAGVDFTLPGETTITFPAGVTTESLDIYLINDRIRRANKTFQVDLKNPVGLSLTNNSATVTIINDNLIPEVDFDFQTQAVSKTSGIATITLSLSSPAPERFVIPYTVSGTAVFNVDDQFSNGLITFQTGDTTATIQGSLINVPGPSLNKTIILSLNAAVDGLAIGSKNSDTLVITDNISNLVAAMAGVPVGTSNVRSLNVSVAGFNVTQYEYKISTSNTCKSAIGYSQAISTNVAITDSITSLSDGPIYLCVLGAGTAGVFQDPSVASVATWTKNTSPPSAPTFQSIISNFVPVSAGVIESNSSTVIAQFASVPLGYTLVLFDSQTCQGLQIGNAVISTATAQVTGTFLGDGNHSLSATLLDEYNQSSSCTPILTTYTLDTVQPVVTDVSTTTPSGFYTVGPVGAPTNMNIVVTFSKPIFVTGLSTQTPYLIMNTTPNLANATYVSFSGKTITFLYQVQIGQNASALDYLSQTSLVPSGSAIKDLAGNSAVLTLPIALSSGRISSKSNITIDTIPPLAVLAFSDGTWGTPTLSPAFTWTSSSDPGGSGIANYQIAIGSQAGLSDILFWTNTTTSNFFQTPMVLAANTTYYGSIRVIDKAGNISGVTVGQGFVIDNKPPLTPVVTVSVTSTFSNSQSPTLSWPVSTDNISGLDHYELAIGTSRGATDLVDWLDVGTVTSYVAAYTASFGVNYYASVRAVDKAGNISTGFSLPWLVVKPVVVPNPLPTFTNQTNVTLGSKVLSNSQTIAGLSIPSSVAVSGAGGNPKIIINGGAPVTSGTINNGDVVQLQMTASSYGNESFTETVNFSTTPSTWTISTWSCPANYTYIPPAAANQPDFCISKYQINIPGSERASSDPGIAPSLTDQATASAACSNLGSQYSLITNTQWEVVAHNIESTGWNWSGGAMGQGKLSGGVINSTVYPEALPPPSSDDNVSCSGASGISCDLNTWSKYRRVMQLSTGRYLWDFTGLAWQWTIDAGQYSNFSDTTAYYCPNGLTQNCFYNLTELTSSFLMGLFGPAGNYQGLFPSSNTGGIDWGGIGQIVDTHPLVTSDDIVSLARGGAQGDDDQGYWHGGVFSGRITQGPFQQQIIQSVTQPAFRMSTNNITSSMAPVLAPTPPALPIYPVNAAGGYGCSLPISTLNPTTGVITTSASCPDLATSVCKDLASCTKEYAFGTNCTINLGFLNPVWLATTNGSPVGTYVWSITCDVVTGDTTVPGAGTGAARCVYTNP